MLKFTRTSISLLFILLTLIPISAQDTNVCVTDYDSDVDYFPDKLTIDHALGFTVEYFNHYKVINVLNPWFGATEDDTFQYVLFLCGTPTPDGFDDAQIIEVPIEDSIVMSTTILPHFVELDLLDNLVGVDTTAFTTSPDVLALAEDGELIEVGGGATLNIELILDTNPDLVMTFGSGSPEFDAHPVLLDAGIPVAINADYVESSPLGRAEWIKFTALFYNAEAEVNAFFGDIESAYVTAQSLAQDISADTATFLWNSFSSFTDSWTIPGAETYSGQLINDAGGTIALAELAPNISAFADFETVYESTLESDVWMVNAFGVFTLDDLLAQDERYADFSALANGTVYNTTADFYESGVTNPHLVLLDIIAMLYPKVLPDHELVYFFVLE